MHSKTTFALILSLTRNLSLQNHNIKTHYRSNDRFNLLTGSLGTGFKDTTGGIEGGSGVIEVLVIPGSTIELPLDPFIPPSITLEVKEELEVRFGLDKVEADFLLT